MTREIVVMTGEFKFAKGDCLLLTRGVGSCVVACLWDGGRQAGGMAHIPMPGSAPASPAPRSSLDRGARGARGARGDRGDRGEGDEAALRPGLFADTALAGLLRLMLAGGARRDHVSVRLVGAGNMFEGRDGGFMGDVSKGVLAGVTAAVKSLGLFVAAQSVGGMYGRSVFFDVAGGLIRVRLTNGDQIAL